MINSRRKGKAAEREVAKLLEAWWSKVEEGCKFVSTPLSGGFSTAAVRGAFNMAGDLMTTAEAFPYTVEVKHREKWSLANVIAGKRCPVWAWWKQCQKAAAEEGKIPMLWFRKNRDVWYMFLPESELVRLVPNTTKLTFCVSPPVKRDVGHLPVMLLASEFLSNV